MSFKFNPATFHEWKQDPETWWRKHGIMLTPEQKKWFTQQQWSKWTFQEFKDQITKSKLFTGMYDWM